MTDRFIQDIRLITKESILSEVYLQARKCLIDYLAVTISGACSFSGKALDYIQTMGHGNENATVIGLNCKTDMQTASLINGMNAHVLELDDGHRQGALHVGSTIFSAL
jgi:2-methylcitrate dehydratase PrpD